MMEEEKNSRAKIDVANIAHVMEYIYEDDIDTLVTHLIACKTMLKINGVDNMEDIDIQANDYAERLNSSFGQFASAFKNLFGNDDKED